MFIDLTYIVVKVLTILSHVYWFNLHSCESPIYILSCLLICFSFLNMYHTWKLYMDYTFYGWKKFECCYWKYPYLDSSDWFCHLTIFIFSVWLKSKLNDKLWHGFPTQRISHENSIHVRKIGIRLTEWWPHKWVF